MPSIQITDRAAGGKPRRTADGYLVADVLVARTGVQQYLGSELGRPDLATVNVYRPPEVVFAKDAMRSYAHRPVTNDHKGTVTSKNWKDVAAGMTGDDVMRDGEYVRVPLALMDEAAIKDYEAGKVELSMGYNAGLDFIDGISPEGEPYNAVLTSQSMNHLALVHKARGGDKLRIGDTRDPDSGGEGAQPNGGHQMADEKKTVIFDGISIEVTPQGAQVIEKLQAQLKDSGVTLSARLADHNTQIAAKDAEIAALKGKVLTDAQLDKLIADRATLLTTARTVFAGGLFDGLTAAAVHSLVVAHKLGDAAIVGKDAAYLAARFDMLAEDAAKAKPADPMAKVLADATNTPNPTDNGQGAYQKRVADGWKNTK